MDKWYISENGRVTGPLKIDDVQRMIAKNNDLYGWNPSYSHWLPITKIAELSEFLPEDHSSDQVSKELIDKFVNRKRDLNKKAALINSSIEVTVEKMALFEQEINKYKQLTTPLSQDVQDNIIPLEKKYIGIGKQLTDLQKALAISKQEINDAVKEFGELVLNKSTENYEDFAELAQTTPAQPKASSVTPSLVKTPAENNTPVSTNAVESIATERVKTDTNRSASSNVPLALRGTVVDYNNSKETKPAVVSIRKDDQASSSVVAESSKVNAEKMDFKSKLKSVFSKQSNPEELTKLSDRLRLLEKEAPEKINVHKSDVDEEVVFLDYDVESQLDDESDNTKKRRRRRRV